MKTEVTVLTAQQLADRWQVSLSKIYLDSNMSKLPHLKANKNRFPVEAIEAMENEAGFDKNNISTQLERRQKKEIRELKERLELKNKQIAELKLNMAKAQVLLTQIVYEDVKDAFQI